MPELHTSRLHEYIEAVLKEGGNYKAKSVLDKFSPLDLRYDTFIDQNISPYSDEYFQQQMNLYKEISGRNIDQEQGELHPVSVEALLEEPNPIGIRNAADMGELVRALSSMLVLSGVTGESAVLDMGAGHGLSSEIFAFTGCKVHAIDIDPALGRLSRARAERRGLEIIRSDMNFDNLDSIENQKYDAAFFSQSFHHCLRPWKLIESLRTKLAADGVIGFVGEPINTYWWKNWGIRLDQESLFVARNLGWFESGWSHDFISDCFARNGMILTFFDGGYIGGEIGLATQTVEKRDALIAKAASLGFAVRRPGREADQRIEDERYLSLIGIRGTVYGKSGFIQNGQTPGTLVYGPYVNLKAGEYEFSLIVKKADQHVQGGKVKIDVASNFGNIIHFIEYFSVKDLKKPELIIRKFTLPENCSGLEVRIKVPAEGDWSASLPEISPVQ